MEAKEPSWHESELELLVFVPQDFDPKANGLWGHHASIA